MFQYEDDVLLKVIPSKRQLLTRYRELFPHRPAAQAALTVMAETHIFTGLEPIAEKVLALSYPYIHRCSAPKTTFVTSMARKVERLARKRGLECFPNAEERFQTALIACYELIVQYVKEPRPYTIWTYLSKYLPEKYVAELLLEYPRAVAPPVKAPGTSVPVVQAVSPVLPVSEADYIDRFVRADVAAAGRDLFPFLGRTNIYRIIGRVSGKHHAQTPAHSMVPDSPCSLHHPSGSIECHQSGLIGGPA